MSPQPFFTPSDDGGLDLELFSKNEQHAEETLTPEKVRELAPRLSALADMESLLGSADDIAEEEPALDVNALIPPPPVRPPVPEPELLNLATNQDGLDLQGAINLSPFLRMAGIPLASNPKVLLVSNNLRFWTATADTFDPILHECVYSHAEVRKCHGWRPILGNEFGLYLK
jgi:hypothetical protein